MHGSLFCPTKQGSDEADHELPDSLVDIELKNAFDFKSAQ